jgi:hypothetical protein
MPKNFHVDQPITEQLKIWIPIKINTVTAVTLSRRKFCFSILLGVACAKKPKYFHTIKFISSIFLDRSQQHDFSFTKNSFFTFSHLIIMCEHVTIDLKLL